MPIAGKENAGACSPYRWVILSVIVLVQVALNGAQFQLAGLAARLIPALALRPEQFAMVLAAPMLTAALFGIPAGALADRFGVKLTVSIGLLIAAISGFGRLFAGNFGSMFIAMLGLGFGLAAINANAAKIIGAWFSQKQAGLAMGMFVASATAGISLALASSALFAEIQNAFIVSAAIVLASLLLWIVLIRPRPDGVPAAPVRSIARYLAGAARSRNIWIGGAAMFLFMGGWVAQTGNLSNALIQNKGASDVLAGLASSLLPLAFIGGSVIVGPLIMRKLGRMGILLAAPALGAALFSYLAWYLPFGVVTVLLLVLSGFLLGTLVPFVMSLPMLLPELGPDYAGSGGGILSTLQMAGAFLLPSYVIMPLSAGNASNIFLLISCVYVLFGIVLILLLHAMEVR